MASNTLGTAARQDPRQVSNTLKFDVNFNTTGISAGIAHAFYLPQGAFIMKVMVEVVTAFNAATTNTLTVGTNATNYNNIVSSADCPGNGTVSLSAGTTDVTRGWGRSIAATADQQVFIKYAQTGAAATTGRAVVVIEFEGGWSS